MFNIAPTVPVVAVAAKVIVSVFTMGWVAVRVVSVPVHTAENPPDTIVVEEPHSVGERNMMLNPMSNWFTVHWKLYDVVLGEILTVKRGPT